MRSRSNRKSEASYIRRQPLICPNSEPVKGGVKDAHGSEQSSTALDEQTVSALHHEVIVEGCEPPAVGDCAEAETAAEDRTDQIECQGR